MLRRRIRDTAFTVEYMNAGKRSRTDMAICYLEDMADKKYVAQLKERLSSIDTDSVILGHQSIAESLIRTRWYNPFPKIRTTERPDAAAACILEGSVLVFVDNSPEAMILPTSIFDFLQETDDFYFPPLTGSYLRLIRHFVFFASMLLTPVWISPDIKSRHSARGAWLSPPERSGRNTDHISAISYRIYARRLEARFAEHSEHA